MYLKIETNEELFKLVSLIKENYQWIAVDTEFERRDTYFPKLSLIQIATTEQVWIIDTLKLNEKNFLKDLFENKEILKVFHAGEQDWQAIEKYCNAKTYPFIDIQIMATFASFGSSLSMEKLALSFLNKKIDKSLQNSKWMKRPLSKKQLTYAATDAICVAHIYPILKEKLIEMKRLDWVQEDMEILVNNFSNISEDKEWMKFCTQKCRWPTALYAYYLTKWRNNLARIIDKPKQHIMNNATLENLIKQKKHETYQEKNCPKGYYEDFLKTWHEIENLVSDTEIKKNLRKILKKRKPMFSKNQTIKFETICKAITKTANELNIPENFIMTKQEAAVAFKNKGKTTASWKMEILKKYF